MLTCKDASHLVSHSQDRPLSFRERWALRLHLWMCVSCRNFERQVALIRRVLRQPEHAAPPDTPDRQLPAEARERIRRAIAEQQDHSAKPSA